MQYSELCTWIAAWDTHDASSGTPYWYRQCSIADVSSVMCGKTRLLMKCRRICRDASSIPTRLVMYSDGPVTASPRPMIISPYFRTPAGWGTACTTWGCVAPTAHRRRAPSRSRRIIFDGLRDGVRLRGCGRGDTTVRGATRCARAGSAARALEAVGGACFWSWRFVRCARGAICGIS